MFSVGRLSGFLQFWRETLEIHSLGFLWDCKWNRGETVAEIDRFLQKRKRWWQYFTLSFHSFTWFWEHECKIFLHVLTELDLKRSTCLLAITWNLWRAKPFQPYKSDQTSIHWEMIIQSPYTVLVYVVVLFIHRTLLPSLYNPDTMFWYDCPFISERPLINAVVSGSWMWRALFWIVAEEAFIHFLNFVCQICSQTIILE